MSMDAVEMTGKAVATASVSVAVTPESQANRARTKSRRNQSSNLVHGRDMLQMHDRVDEMDFRGKLVYHAESLWWRL